MHWHPHAGLALHRSSRVAARRRLRARQSRSLFPDVFHDQVFSPASARNRDPILEVLQRHVADRRNVLEIGAGTGQHAVHFAAAMPWLRWQASDHADHLPGMTQWLDEAALPNTPPPIALQAVLTPTPGLAPTPPLPPARAGEAAGYDAVYSANTLHIMGWPQVPGLVCRVAGGDGAGCAAGGVWAVQPQWAIHQREQPRIRCDVARARPCVGNPRCRSSGRTGGVGGIAADRRRGVAGEQLLSGVVAAVAVSVSPTRCRCGSGAVFQCSGLQGPGPGSALHPIMHGEGGALRQSATAPFQPPQGCGQREPGQQPGPAGTG